MIKNIFDDDGNIIMWKAHHFQLTKRVTFVNMDHKKAYATLVFLIELKKLLFEKINKNKILNFIKKTIAKSKTTINWKLIESIKNWLDLSPEIRKTGEQAIIEMIINKIIWLHEEITYMISSFKAKENRNRLIETIIPKEYYEENI